MLTFDNESRDLEYEKKSSCVSVRKMVKYFMKKMATCTTILGIYESG